MKGRRGRHPAPSCSALRAGLPAPAARRAPTFRPPAAEGPGRTRRRRRYGDEQLPAAHADGVSRPLEQARVGGNLHSPRAAPRSPARAPLRRPARSRGECAVSEL